ncbi:MAG TPA: aldolase/citrate lyase family protein [Ardenticatenaceae bacterium]|nr:aldolase/citrate lyase family protein [Ardenticatenaceae bacterium]
MRANTTKARLKNGETVFGCFVRYPDATLVEVLGYQGWDFLVFDGEHGTIEPRDCEHLVRAAELRGVTPIVRVTTNSPPTILRFMDSGAQGLHVPWVNSGPEAEAAVRAVKYHPRGVRGLAGVRAADFGQGVALDEYVRQANQETLVVIHIETAEAVERLPEIVAVDGVDVVFIGPTDLSHSLGVPGQPSHPAVQAAMDRIVVTVAQSDAALGIIVGNAQAAREWRARGARYITIMLEALLRPAIQDYLRLAGGPLAG